MMKWLCKLGWHSWIKRCQRKRFCMDCGKEQFLEFYINRTQEWVDK